ncbi:MAG: hypothetical protein K0U79_09585 [Gammaproteobacteria bacterium]|nr:hypothetical protein [Gammaproteobacteria bacterium]
MGQGEKPARRPGAASSSRFQETFKREKLAHVQSLGKGYAEPQAFMGNGFSAMDIKPVA